MNSEKISLYLPFFFLKNVEDKIKIITFLQHSRNKLFENIYFAVTAPEETPGCSGSASYNEDFDKL